MKKIYIKTNMAKNICRVLHNNIIRYTLYTIYLYILCSFVLQVIYWVQYNNSIIVMINRYLDYMEVV